MMIHRLSARDWHVTTALEAFDSLPLTNPHT